MIHPILTPRELAILTAAHRAAYGVPSPECPTPREPTAVEATLLEARDAFLAGRQCRGWDLLESLGL